MREVFYYEGNTYLKKDLEAKLEALNSSIWELYNDRPNSKQWAT
jgi:hypothetical protein